MNRPKRILLGHLGSNGDCLYATAVARQIKHDYPACHLTWAVGSLYRQAVENNPYVDEIWEVPVANRNEVEIVWKRFVQEAKHRKKSGEFDKIFFTQINPDNYRHFDGTVRSSTFRGYPRPITVPITPTIRLREEEIAWVHRFAELHGLAGRKLVVLFECAAASSQSFVTPEFAMETARLVRNTLKDCAFILSSNVKITSSDELIIDGSVVPLRGNAELTKYCTLLVGCSSGVSWLATTDWAKPLPKIQLLSKQTSVYASMCHDAEYFGLPTDSIIEMTDCSTRHLADCIAAALIGSFADVRQRFHEQIEVDLHFYLERFMRSQLRQLHLLTITLSFFRVYQRYGLRPFVRYIKTKTHLSNKEYHH